MNKSKKILIILINLILIMIIFSTVTSASLVNVFENSIDKTGSGTRELKEKGADVLGVIRVVGILISVGMLMIIGIKYMLGSSEEKAEYKKSLFPYFIGAVLIFAATTLADVIYGWAKEL